MDHLVAPRTVTTPPELASLVELLGRHHPPRADELRRLLCAPAPDPVPVLGTLSTGLDEVLARRSARREPARRRLLATEDAIRRRRDELSAQRREALVGWPQRLRAELADLRLTASGELAAAVRRLRDDARAHLERADPADRARFPDRLGSAVAVLTGRVRERLDASVLAVAGGLLGELDPGGHVRFELGPARHPPPRIRPPDRAGRSSVEDHLTLLLGASGGVGVGRLALVPAAGMPSLPSVLTVPVAVGLGVGGAWWLARARRDAADRARLGRWMAEVLADTRSGLEASLAERVLEAERRLRAVVERAAAGRVAELDAELAGHERGVRRIAVRRAELAVADAAALAELRAARTEAGRLLAAALAEREVER